MVYSVIWTNERIYSTICLRMQTGNKLMLCQLETNKRYAILLESLGDLCLKVGFCLSGDSI